MPFTLSHPAAILPLCRPPFVVSALVAGAVAPDLPYVLPAATSADWGIYSDFTLTYTHRLIPGTIVGLALLALYHLLFRRPLIALLPVAVDGTFRWGGVRRFAWIVVSVVLGVLTHLVWDGLVHTATAVGTWWWASTVAGALALAARLYHWWRHTPARPARWWPILIPAAGGMAGAVTGDSLRSVATGALSGAGAGLILYAVAWQLIRPLRKTRPLPPSEPASVSGGPSAPSSAGTPASVSGETPLPGTHPLPASHNDQVTDRDTLRDIWNRACDGEGTGPGDRHLAAVILVDNMVQNGGPNHAADSCEPAQLAAAAVGARYFGLVDLASVIEQLPAAASDLDDDEAEERLSAGYHEVLPDSSRLDEALAARYAAAPEDFQPL